MSSQPREGPLPPTVAMPGPHALPTGKPGSALNDATTLTAHPAGTPPTAPVITDRHAVPGYEILGELGRGGMGVVYLARQLGVNRLVALKMVRAGSHAGKEDLARFRLEAEAVGRLAHPNIVQVHQVGLHEGMPFLSLEYCAGGTLASKLQGKPLLPRQAAELVEALARAVHAAHSAGVVHRDLKPGNVLLAPCPPGEEGPALGVPKITDFGLAKMRAAAETAPGPEGLTRSGDILGTPSYMAPEQAAANSSRIGPACDVYGLGAILYECLTGKPPFIAATHVDTVMQVMHSEPLPPRMLNRQIDADLERVCLKCLEKLPERRYATAGELADDLRRYLGGEPVEARGVNLLERLQRELAYSGHDTQLRPWGFGLMLLGALILLSHLATSLLLLAGLREIPAFWVPRSLLLVAIVPLVLRYRPHHSVWPTNSVERLIWAVWAGYLLTFVTLFWVMKQMGHRHLEIYGVAAALSGLAWFTMGGHAWGGCYLIGGAFLLAAPVMVGLHGSPWAPFVFGLLWAAALLTLGGRYWRLGKGQAPP
jgi:eukaryotic-like serine/threonine-protein kinase